MPIQPYPEIESPVWDRGLERVLANGVNLRFQPIVDLRRGLVAGYETLARFEGPPHAPPDRWFAAAEHRGVALELEERVWRGALEARNRLPLNTFLSLNASPEFLCSASCAELIGRVPSLHRLVIEVTEHRAIDDYKHLSSYLNRYREAGASLAVDDAGAGYASMNHILELRPQFVKLDRAFVTNCHKDPAKAALIEMVGRFASNLDAWLLAEGIEETAELETLVRMGVPLGQGYLLARPEEDWSEVPPRLRAVIRRITRDIDSGSTVSAVIEEAPAVSGPEAGALNDANDVVVLVDDQQRPLQVLQRSEKGWKYSTALWIKQESSVETVLRRALTRQRDERFAPLVCVNDEGVYIGIVRIDTLIVTLLGDRDPKKAAA